MGKKQAEWGEAHRREALRRTYEIAAEVSGRDAFMARMLAAITQAHEQEATWRGKLAAGGLDAARIGREVRRVRALADGRLVRETEEAFGVRTPWEDKRIPALTFDDAKGAAKHWRGSKHDPGRRCRAVRVRVTRIRRARAT